MKLKSLVATLALACGVGSATAATFASPTVVNGSFSDQVLGTVVVSGPGLFNITGSLFDIEGTLSSPFGSVTFSNVSLTGGSIGAAVFTGLNFLAPNLMAGNYTLKASGTVDGGGLGLINANYNVTAVPEPETYALMLAGLASIGFMLRRRNV